MTMAPGTKGLSRGRATSGTLGDSPAVAQLRVRHSAERQRVLMLEHRLAQVDAAQTPQAHETLQRLIEATRHRLRTIEAELGWQLQLPTTTSGTTKVGAEVADVVRSERSQAPVDVTAVLPADEIRARLQLLDLVIARNAPESLAMAAGHLRLGIRAILKDLEPSSS